MIDNIVTSINAGFTKVAGQSSSSKSKKTKEKVINLDDLKKIQVIPKIGETGRKKIKYDESLIQCPEYNNKGKNVKSKRNYIDFKA